MGSGHSPVPLGCHCGYVIEWSYRDHRPDVEQWFCVSYQGGREVITWVTTRDRVSYQIIGFGRVHLVSAAELNKTLCHHKLPVLPDHVHS